MNEISVQSATQLNKILSFLTQEDKQKIPADMIRILEKKADTIDTKIRKISDIDEENILPETRKYLAYIFLNYLATEEEKQEYSIILKNNERQYQNYLKKKFNPENIFGSKQKNIKNESIEEKQNLPVVSKKNIFQWIWEKLKRIGRKKI